MYCVARTGTCAAVGPAVLHDFSSWTSQTTKTDPDVPYGHCRSAVWALLFLCFRTIALDGLFQRAATELTSVFTICCCDIFYLSIAASFVYTTGEPRGCVCVGWLKLEFSGVVMRNSTGNEIPHDMVVPATRIRQTDLLKLKARLARFWSHARKLARAMASSHVCDLQTSGSFGLPRR